jgi:hypothetical protein
MVVSTAVADEDFRSLFENTTAGVLIIIMDSIKSIDRAALTEAHENRLQFIKDLFEIQNVWGALELEGAAGAFLYRKNNVVAITELGRLKSGALRYLSVSITLQEADMNPTTAVAVGVCYRVKQTLQKSPIWPVGFLTNVSQAVRAEGVRFLGGIFDCPSDQAAGFARSCGALPPSPFTQAFR